MAKASNVDTLYATYANITERFYDRSQSLVYAARAGDWDSTEIGSAAVEAMIDGVEAITLPWLMLVGAKVTLPPVVRQVRFAVDASKLDQLHVTRIRVGAKAVLTRSPLTWAANPKVTIAKDHVVPTRSTDVPENRLVVALTKLHKVLKKPAGIYKSTIKADKVPIAIVIVGWPG